MTNNVALVVNIQIKFAIANLQMKLLLRILCLTYILIKMTVQIRTGLSAFLFQKVLANTLNNKCSVSIILQMMHQKSTSEELFKAYLIAFN
jgi:hypothetical protein